MLPSERAECCCQRNCHGNQRRIGTTGERDSVYAATPTVSNEARFRRSSRRASYVLKQTETHNVLICQKADRRLGY
ncbi:hypothetical protein LSAT2_016951 [Lamellibrachia satsuma]|nr:hypothetical protein LSAT2_016951 [Lamellibrachia satsuma]